MKTKSRHASLQWVIGTVLLVSGVLILGNLISLSSITYAQSNVSNLNVVICNYTPTSPRAMAVFHDNGGITYVAPGGVIPGIVGGTVNVIANFFVGDGSGYDNDNIQVKARFIRTSNSGASPINHVNTESGGNDNDAIFYASSVETTSMPMSGPVNCALLYVINDTRIGTNTNGMWQCTVPMPYLADPTTTGSSVNSTLNYAAFVYQLATWTTDNETQPATVSDNYTYPLEFPNVLGLSTDAVLDLGVADTAGTPTGAVSVNVENKGNQQLDIALEVNKQTDASAWTCSGSGNPLVSDLHHAVNGGDLNYNMMTALTLNLDNTGNLETGFDLVRGVVRSTPSKNFEKFRFATVQPIGAGTCTLSAIVMTALIGY